MKILVTGGAGFIGSELVRQLIGSGCRVITVDSLSYAGNLDSLRSVWFDGNHVFEKADIRGLEAMRTLFRRHQPEAVIHLAAESHVDRSIAGPAAFINTNITGTFNLLEAAREYLDRSGPAVSQRFRFLHVSTDEVFGSLPMDGGLFTEETAYDPSSPYSASKAASDHLVRAWHRTFGLPALVTNCSNNYGPCQFPEKMIPLMITHAVQGKKLPVYGQGLNVRDWLYVGDHARALRLVLEKGTVGQTYNIGGMNEMRNIDVVRMICSLLDEMLPSSAHRPHDQLLSFVTDRPGHDLRYAIDCSKIQRELGWQPKASFPESLRGTVAWYLENRAWWQAILDGSYRAASEGLLRDRPAHDGD